MTNTGRQVDYYTLKDRKIVRGFGIAQLVLGIVSIAFGIATCAANGLYTKYYSINGYTGTGIWCGVFTFATGIVGWKAAYANTYLKLISYTVVSFIELLLSVVLTSLSVYSLVETNKPCPISLYSAATTTRRPSAFSRSSFTRRRGTGGFHHCTHRNGLFAADLFLSMIGITLICFTVYLILITIKSLRGKSSPANANRAPSPFKEYSEFQRSFFKRVGLVQLLLGIVSVVFGIVTCAVNHTYLGYYYSLNGYIGSGIWAGVFLISVGVVTRTSALHNTYRRIVASIIQNIVGSLVALLLLIISIVSIATTNKQCPFNQYYSSRTPFRSSGECTSMNALLAADSILTISSLLELVLAIVCALISMRVLCKPSSSEVESSPTLSVADFQPEVFHSAASLNSSQPSNPPDWRTLPVDWAALFGSREAAERVFQSAGVASAPPVHSTTNDLPPSYESLQPAQLQST